MQSSNGDLERWLPGIGGEKPSRSTRRGWMGGRVLFALAAVFALFFLVSISKGFYTEWLWFSSLGYGDVYTTILQTKVLLYIAAVVIFFTLFFGNFFLATRLTPKGGARSWPWEIVIVLTALLALLFGTFAQANWNVVLQFFNGQPFGITDPVFNKEIGFYVFSLPFLQLVRGWLLSMLIITLLSTAGVYAFSYMAQRLNFDFSRPVLAHLGGLGIVILGLFAWGYWLGIWELVFSSRGVVFGASFADMNAKLPAQWVMMAVVILCIATIIVSIFQRHYRWAVYGIGGWIAIGFLVGAIYPSLVQRLQVQPNELGLEKQYIEYNIDSTREAFALNRIEEKPFPAEKSPTAQDVAQNEITINNIRLWDHRPLKDTYNQIQSIRLYYDFVDVDVDRYMINGEYRQVMLSARELSVEKLPAQAQTWVNQRLQFTHGYGIALSPVNEISEEGLPVLFVKDIPPVGDLEIEQPQIYFGEKTNHYVIANTNTEEFDYPMGDENVYGHYQGKDGVSIGSFINRLVYAWQFGDLNILISGELTSESKVLFYRNIQERVRHLAPFLWLDEDPYLVVADGRLVWIQDAYTFTNRYPYSEPFSRNINYIRNSVKAVIDAYNGDVTFYVAEPDDALIQTYQAIFPNLFVSIEQMPKDLRAHVRYPEGMFNIQSAMYQSYHMQDARVFYNKEDLWTVPKEIYAGTEQAMEPYYVIMRLPDEQEEEFLLMFPFTPVNKNNTIGWLAARCDGDNYGKLLAYLFPKERLIYGPSQIENRIQQDTTITEQLALWGRGGSRVLRGNLLLIPLGKSNLYVEPIFLQANAGGLPELKRVIVAAGDRIAMEPTLKESLVSVFGLEAIAPDLVTEELTKPEPEKPITEPLVQPSPRVYTTQEKAAEMADLINEAQLHYDGAREYVKKGDWAGYGRELDALEAVLQQLAELTTEDSN